MSKFLDTAMQDLIASMDCRLNKLQAHVDEYNEILAAKQRIIGTPKAPKKLVGGNEAMDRFIAIVQKDPGKRVCELIRKYDLDKTNTYNVANRLAEQGTLKKRGFLYYAH